MDGSSRAFGVGGEITLCGQTFRANARILRCYAEAEAEIISRRGDPAKMLASQAKELQEFNTRPFLQALSELADRLKDEKSWNESQRNAVKTFLKTAEKELDKTPYFESVFGMALDAAKDWSGVSLEELDVFHRTVWKGQCMRLWYAIRDHDPHRRMTLQEVTELFSDEIEARSRMEDAKEKVSELFQQIDAAITQAEGNDDLGNSNGSPSQS